MADYMMKIITIYSDMLLSFYLRVMRRKQFKISLLTLVIESIY